MKIIVTGSLGNIGKPLTEALVQKGDEVIVISSNPEKIKEIESLGAKAAIGSLEDVDFLVNTFKDADAVHAMVPPNFSAADPVKDHIKIGYSIVDAIAKAGVKHVVYVSSYGANLVNGTGSIAGHHFVEEALKALPLESLTLLRNTYIYYNLFAYVGLIKNAGLITTNYGGDDLQILVSPKDIAAAAAEELEKQTPGTHVRYVASDERNCNEIAHVLGEAIGKPDLKWLTTSSEETKNGFKAFGMTDAAAEQYTEMFEACHTGLLNEDYELHKPKVLGKVKLEDFAKEFAAVYNQ